jgi:hypothetical protein
MAPGHFPLDTIDVLLREGTRSEAPILDVLKRIRRDGSARQNPNDDQALCCHDNPPENVRSDTASTRS